MGYKQNGYGRFIVKWGQNRTVHRLVWELTNGPIPDGLHVLHRCDNPACCNPDHLYLGTHAENMADKARKGRSRNQWTGSLLKPRRRRGLVSADLDRLSHAAPTLAAWPALDPKPGEKPLDANARRGDRAGQTAKERARR